MNQMHQDFESPASETTLEQVAEKIRERNIDVVIVNNGEEARQIVLERIPAARKSTPGNRKR